MARPTRSTISPRSSRTSPAGARTRVVLTAHSLPDRAVRAGDPYPALVEATARAVIAALERAVDWTLAYQSQGMGSEGWLGPDLPAALRDARGAGVEHVVL